MTKQFSKSHVENAVTYLAYGGMCDRLYNIATLHTEVGRLGKRLNVIWLKDACCGCGYADIFEPLDNTIVFPNAPDFLIPPAKLWSLNRLRELRHVSKIIQKRFWQAFVQHITQESIFDKYICHTKYENLRPFENAVVAALEEKNTSICIAGVVRWIADFNLFVSPFRLQKPLYEKMLRLTEGWDEHVIGIHARHYEPSPFHDPQFTTSVATVVMKHEIDKNNRARFFLATDSEVTRQKLTHSFGDRIITQGGEVLGRGSEEGVKRAAIDLYALALTNKIIGVKTSGYSMYASRMGKIPLVEVLLPSQHAILIKQKYAGA